MSIPSILYRKQVQSLLPKGKLWNREENSALTKLLYGFADELARIDDRASNLMTEKLIASTDELITEHETDFEIPEEGESLFSTLELRRGEVLSKLLEIGQQNEEYFTDICSALGYTAIVVEYKPAWSGVVIADELCGDINNLFFWKILIDVDSVEESVEVNLDVLIKKMERIKPGHSHFLVDFYNAGFSRGFERGFRRIPHYDNWWMGLDFDCGFSDGFSNNKSYYGTNYNGGFGYGFSIDFDRNSGGGFESDGFETSSFTHPA